MCLGIPMQIKTIDGYTARCEAKGVQRDVSLFMLQDENLQLDDYAGLFQYAPGLAVAEEGERSEL